MREAERHTWNTTQHRRTTPHSLASVTGGAARGPAAETVSEAERALEDFVRLASHELRGPLSTISLAIDVMRSSLDGGASVSHLKTTDRCVTRISTLLDTLVELVMIEREGFLLCKEPVDAQTIADQAIAAARACRARLPH